MWIAKGMPASKGMMTSGEVFVDRCRDCDNLATRVVEFLKQNPGWSSVSASRIQSECNDTLRNTNLFDYLYWLSHISVFKLSEFFQDK